ncbi:MAG: excinuclease ABC subunit UvrA [Erysipelotrichaceae bacterium]|jgi:excinuclease ABC subunit A|nr:excinuclease ABC subunit UvrA [Erysipelotrichaceae bacterium]
MENKYIKVKGARENNLKNVSVEIPKDSFVVFTGLSGSGKSTLAFDTIFAEGQRRYVESLSSYARQFLGNLEKPDVDAIEGLSPAISIDQKGSSHNPRSTVGTVTEIYDYLRLLYARIGVPYCPNDGEEIVAYPPSMMVDTILSYTKGTKVQILSPVVRSEKGTQKDILDKLKQNGFERLRVDGKFMLISEVPELEKNKKHSIDIVLDRLIIKDDIRSRVYDSVETALDWSHGYLTIYTEAEEKMLSEHNTCKICGFSVPKLEPRLFSFNSPSGFCPECKGLGVRREAEPGIIIPNDNLSINDSAITYYKNTIHTTNLEWQEFELLCKLYKVPMDKPFKDLTKEEKKIVFIGSPVPHKYTLKSASGNIMHRYQYIEGIKTKIERLYSETTSDFMRDYYEKFMVDHECTRCHGSRLNDAALSVRVDGLNIYEVCLLSIENLYKWISSLEAKLSTMNAKIAHLIIIEIANRTKFLTEVGLEYLTLARTAMTLSGGEAQRIRLATQIGSRLSGVLYVLDEPSIGLHQRDDVKLIHALKEMRDLGNTLIVVEHDEETIKSADYIVDIGPGAGKHGGEIVASGTLADIMNEPRSITGQYLSNKKYIPIPKIRLKGNGKKISINGAKCHNLKKISVDIPLGCFVAVTGVSGSGKSSLINQTLYPYLKHELDKHSDPVVIEVNDITGLENIDKVINVSQEPIGRTPRSNPATYTKVFDEIRALFSETIEAKARGFDKGRFSFNVPGGRCENCQGAGVMRVPMNFLPDIYVKCDVCGGRRYNEETLQITYKGKNIFEVLEMTVEEGMKFFENRPSIYNKIKTLYDVGLGYIKLGQPATTLSGGEAQRVKLAYELQRKPTGKTLYILDEPTTGLHIDDIARLIKVLKRIVDNGDTVLVIEHNLDVIKVADYIIDLGPEGGDKGGNIVAKGTPEQVANNKKSYTGYYLKDILSHGIYE